MSLSSTWDILAIIAILSLIISFFIGKNAVWGTFTLGLIVGVIAGFIFKDAGFNWILFKKILVISTLVGAFFELIGRLSQAKKTRS